MLEAIVAVYADWGIGNGITQPVVLTADRAHFRSVTKDAAVIVGRKTLEDFPGRRPLKGRHNIIVTRQDLTVPGAEVVHSTEEALSAAEDALEQIEEELEKQEEGDIPVIEVKPEKSMKE